MKASSVIEVMKGIISEKGDIPIYISLDSGVLLLIEGVTYLGDGEALKVILVPDAEEE